MAPAVDAVTRREAFRKPCPRVGGVTFWQLFGDHRLIFGACRHRHPTRHPRITPGQCSQLRRAPTPSGVSRRLPLFSLCWEAGGLRRVFGGVRPLLRRSWSLGCKATIGRAQSWWCGTNKLYFVSQPPPQPRTSRHKPRSWIYSRCLAALQQAMPATLARVSLWPFKRAPNTNHPMLNWPCG